MVKGSIIRISVWIITTVVMLDLMSVLVWASDRP